MVCVFHFSLALHSWGKNYTSPPQKYPYTLSAHFCLMLNQINVVATACPAALQDPNQKSFSSPATTCGFHLESSGFESGNLAHPKRGLFHGTSSVLPGQIKVHCQKVPNCAYFKVSPIEFNGWSYIRGSVHRVVSHHCKNLSNGC